MWPWHAHFRVPAGAPLLCMCVTPVAYVVSTVFGLEPQISPLPSFKSVCIPLLLQSLYLFRPFWKFLITFKICTSSVNTVARFSVTRDGVWIGNQIYWTLTLVTTNNYDNVTKLHNPKITVTTAQKFFSVFISRCLVAASNGGCSPSSVPELYPASASHVSQL
jgi:hypothetical protein